MAYIYINGVKTEWDDPAEGLEFTESVETALLKSETERIAELEKRQDIADEAIEELIYMLMEV